MPSTTLSVAATGLPTPIRSDGGKPPLERRERSAVDAAHRGDRKSFRKFLRNDHADRFALTDLIARERIRSRIETAIARLIDALDAFDGDPDLEPSMGFYMSQHAPDAEQDAGDEPEVENEHGSDDDNGEPSLGAALNHHDQQHWSQGDRQDLEESTYA